MSEKDKMLSGLPYQPWEKQLCVERSYAKDLLFEFNQIAPSKRTDRCAVLAKLIQPKGKFHVESPFQFDYGYNIHVGDNFYANCNCIILDAAPVHIGDNVFFAPNVSLYTSGHPIHPTLRNEGIEYALSIHIGDNVWIGGNTVINPGVRIGNNVVIGSGSVIHKDIPDNVVAVGNPVRVIRSISDDDYHYFYKNQEF